MSRGDGDGGGKNLEVIHGGPRRRSIWCRCTFTCQSFGVHDIHVIFKSWSTDQIFQKKLKAMFNVRMRHQRQCLKFALCSTGKNRIHSLNLWTFLSFPFHATHSINSLSSRFQTTSWEDVLSTRKGFKDCIEIPSTLLSYMSDVCLQQIWYGWKCRHRIAHLQGFAMLSLDEVLELSPGSQTVIWYR